MLDSKFSTSEKYILLALAAEQVAKDRSIVFHYYGPARLKKYAASLTKQGLKNIINISYSLEDEINSTIEDRYPFFRRTYLTSQLKSLRCLLELDNIKPSGEELFQAVTNILGITPCKPYKLDKVESKKEVGFCHAKVTDKIISSWIEQLIAHFKKDILPNIFGNEKFSKFLDSSKIKQARYKKDYPPCYYVYKGGGKAFIYLSSDHKKNEATVVRTLTHELCPGHHIYYLYREWLFKNGFIGEDASLDLIYSSETPVSEGVAENAFLYFNSANSEFFNQIKEDILVDQFRKKVLYNAWYQRFIECRITEKETADYLIEEGGFAENKVAIWNNFISDWRIYYPSYPLGTERLKESIIKYPKMSLFYFYTPKSIPVLDKLESTFFKERREYEKDSSSSNVCSILTEQAGEQYTS